MTGIYPLYNFFRTKKANPAVIMLPPRARRVP